MNKKCLIFVVLICTVMSLAACKTKSDSNGEAETTQTNGVVDTTYDVDACEEETYFEGIDLAGEETVTDTTNAIAETLSTESSETEVEETKSEGNGGIASKVEDGDLLQPPGKDSAVDLP